MIICPCTIFKIIQNDYEKVNTFLFISPSKNIQVKIYKISFCLLFHYKKKNIILITIETIVFVHVDSANELMYTLANHFDDY